MYLLIFISSVLRATKQDVDDAQMLFILGHKVPVNLLYGKCTESIIAAGIGLEKVC